MCKIIGVWQSILTQWLFCSQAKLQLRQVNLNQIGFDINLDVTSSCEFTMNLQEVRGGTVWKKNVNFPASRLSKFKHICFVYKKAQFPSKFQNSLKIPTFPGKELSKFPTFSYCDQRSILGHVWPSIALWPLTQNPDLLYLMNEVIRTPKLTFDLMHTDRDLYGYVTNSKVISKLFWFSLTWPGATLYLLHKNIHGVIIDCNTLVFVKYSVN